MADIAHFVSHMPCCGSSLHCCDPNVVNSSPSHLQIRTPLPVFLGLCCWISCFYHVFAIQHYFVNGLQYKGGIYLVRSTFFKVKEAV